MLVFYMTFLYCFEENTDSEIAAPDLVRRVEVGDVDSKELWVVGAVANTPDGERLEELGANVLTGVKSAVDILKQQIARDLQLPQQELAV